MLEADRIFLSHTNVPINCYVLALLWLNLAEQAHLVEEKQRLNESVGGIMKSKKGEMKGTDNERIAHVGFTRISILN